MPRRPARRQRLSRRETVALGILAALVLTGAIATAISPSSPSPKGPHPYLPGLSFDGSNTPVKGISKACGMAVDSHGDVYVSSRGYSAIDIFAPGGVYLGEIEDPSLPCSLAVDAKGDVYALDSATGDVVERAPTAYPFRGPPSYGPPLTIGGGGGGNTGVAVDPADGHLYVSRTEHIDAYNSNNTVGQDAVQRVYPSEATAGSFELSFKGRKTRPIPFDATNAVLQRDLEALPTIGPGDISVRNGPRGRDDHLVTFTGALGNTEVGLLAGNGSALRGGARERLVVEQVAEGFSGDLGLGVMKEVTDIAAYANGSTHYVLAADSAGPQPDRIYVFSGPSIGKMTHSATIDGAATPAGSFGFGPHGGRIAVDPEDGHVYLYDAKHSAIDEFAPTGAYLGRFGRSALAGAVTESLAVDRSGDPIDGTLYAGTGSTSNAKVLAFGPRG